MIPCLATVIVNRKDLLQRLIDSIDYPVGVLHVINNSDLKVSLHDIDRNPMVGEYYETVNRQQTGCAGGWNQAIEFAFNFRKLEYLLIFGNDVQCQPGDLQKIAKEVTPDTDFISANQAFSSWGLTQRGFAKLGWLDENTFPAYGEDLDYWRRVQLHGDIRITSIDTKLIHGEAPTWGSHTIYSDAQLKAHNAHTQERNMRYLEKKWQWNRQLPMASAKYTRPFGDTSKPLWFWELSDQRREQAHFRKNG